MATTDAAFHGRSPFEFVSRPAKPGLRAESSISVAGPTFGTIVSLPLIMSVGAELVAPLLVVARGLEAPRRAASMLAEAVRAHIAAPFLGGGSEMSKSFFVGAGAIAALG